jgi:5-methylcytosine-specific restriction endonuclease McrA
MDNRKDFPHVRGKVKRSSPHKCVNCGETEELHVHHIVPLTFGGTNRYSNLALLCTKCHGAVHGMSFIDHSKATKAGLKRAKAEGRVGGKPQVPIEKVKKALELYKEMKLTIPEITKETGVSKTTLYKYVKLEREGKLA